IAEREGRAGGGGDLIDRRIRAVRARARERDGAGPRVRSGEAIKCSRRSWWDKAHAVQTTAVDRHRDVEGIVAGELECSAMPRSTGRRDCNVGDDAGDAVELRRR